MSSKEMIEVDSLPLNIVDGATYSINQSNPNTYTHGMFKYPCKFIPEIPRWAITKYATKKSIIMDPFCGSGTTLLEANLAGLDAFGTEIDDVAKMITRVKTHVFSKSELEEINNLYPKFIDALNDNKNPNFIPNINNIEHWFPESSIRDLGILKDTINDIENVAIKEYFLICLASIIKKVSFADDASPKPYVSTKIEKNPPSVCSAWESICQRYNQMIIDLSNVTDFGKAILVDGDALNFSLPQNVDLAITSPPYINAFDYGRTMRLENLWLDTLDEIKLREKKKDYVGTEKISGGISDSILLESKLLNEYYSEIKKLDEKRALIVVKFFEDMKKNMLSVQQSLTKNGKYVLVIGNSTIRGINVESWKVLRELALANGYSYVESFSYVIKNPYIRIPRNGQGGKISEDYVLVISKE